MLCPNRQPAGEANYQETPIVVNSSHSGSIKLSGGYTTVRGARKYCSRQLRDFAGEAAIAASPRRMVIYADTRPLPDSVLIIHGRTAGAFTRMPFFFPKARIASRAT